LGEIDVLTPEKMLGVVLRLWQETGWTFVLITRSVEEALLVGQRLIVMAPRLGRNNRDHDLPFAEMGAGDDLRRSGSTRRLRRRGTRSSRRSGTSKKRSSGR